ncbi:hypothetical protein [Flavobacterium muglaense]|uniref:Glycosyltransferase family 1 protein n=1 Tax=Flavobacterium muglaense TaxID=2764716 RepID=A0A923SEN6_9FLAO|nr:hypothetical protein [Flavobacterium muglaense]MBC5837081.1 hypothetical protein [Flavobacterium muglaense]MBC5843610.1 hypothetical protein [Flavobacterium muglaense]
MMKKIELLNIPNYYTSYYLLGLQQVCILIFKMDINFIGYNNKPVLVFRMDGKIVVIDNDDPVGVHQDLYDICSLYFVTNKLMGHAAYEQPKVKPLYPHYPVNIVTLYCRVFGIGLFRFLKLKEVVRQLYILVRRPVYENYKVRFEKENFIFFSSNIWKKESETNEIRAAFIRFCRADSRIKFEGGFVPRSDGFNYGYDNELNSKKYSPMKFSKLNAKSLVALNNPAVCGAISWRLAEYLNQGLFVLSFPFKVQLPNDFVNSSGIYSITAVAHYKEVLDYVIENPEAHKVIGAKAKLYFDTYCTPLAQAHYIINSLVE